MSYYIGIDLGGTNVKALAIDQNGSILAERHIKTEAEFGSEHVISRMASLIIDMKKKLAADVTAVGVTVPGVLGSEYSVVELMPNFPDQWKGIPLKRKMEELLNTPVYLMNDARAATYGEKKFGAAKNFKDFIYIVIGTGVGGGIMQNGKLLLGSRGVAGEIGHQVIEPKGVLCGCGNHGCLETVASGSAISSAALRFIRQGMPTIMRDYVNNDLNKITPELVTKAAYAGDKPAIEIMEGTAAHLTTTIRNLMALLNPEAIVFGGGVSKSEVLFDLISKKLHEEEILFPSSLGSVQLIRSEFDHFAGAIGIAAWAMDQHNDKNRSE
ncbi:ROK family protein [Sutcliffiella halmapala]|uniref:ROK family protein n=1 Tax=Sutcliffiella halmapala TaxID=79882 RepID=UPI00147291E4|nr:ROK family protein [Sutcliffiella halmapala]